MRHRTLFLIALCWLVLSVVTGWSHWRVWGIGGVNPPGRGVQAVANVCLVFTMPAFTVVHVLMPDGEGTLPLGLAAGALGWGAWAGGFGLLFAARGWLIGRGRSSVEIASASTDLSRRRVLVDGVIGVCVGPPTAAAVYGTVFEPLSLRVRRYDLPIADLPPSLDGLRLVQISDTHLGPRISEAFLREVVARAVALKPDGFLLTGDYIHAGDKHIELAADIFGPLVRGEGARPTFGVLGNHDWYGDAAALSRLLESRGVRMIDNGRLFIGDDRTVTDRADRGALCVAGLGDLIGDRILPGRALDGVPREMPRLVLAHNPDTAELPEIVRGGRRIDAMFSGHTHGGQVSLPIFGPPVTLSRYGRKYIGGVVEGPACRVVMSRGIGMSILPVRIGVPPELVEVRLRATDATMRG
jgi:uncharacterized protein